MYHTTTLKQTLIGKSLNKQSVWRIDFSLDAFVRDVCSNNDCFLNDPLKSFVWLVAEQFAFNG